MINKFYYIIKFSKALKMLLLSLILSFGLISCNNIIEESPSQSGKENEGKGLVKINVALNDNSSSRTALSEINSGYLEEIKLTGIFDGKNYALGSWWNMSQMVDEELYLQTGDWQLKLSAKYRVSIYNYNGTIIYTSVVPFSQTKNITISSDEVENINFELASESDKGSLLFTLTFSDNSNVDHGKYTITKYPSGEEVSGASGPLTISTGPYSKWIEIAKYGEQALENGSYFISVDFYGDATEQNLLNTYSSIINIKKGFLTRLDYHLILNQFYNINWHTNGGVLPAGASLIEHYSMRTINTVTFPALSKEGYYWDGWYTQPDGNGERVTSLPADSTGNKDFYAYFTQVDPTNVQLLPVFPGSYSCTWSSSGSNITITIRDSSASIVTPDSINVLLCINGEATGSQFSSASFEYPAALQNIAAPGNYSFYVTVEINGQSYSFYAISG